MPIFLHYPVAVIDLCRRPIGPQIVPPMISNGRRGPSCNLTRVMTTPATSLRRGAFMHCRADQLAAAEGERASIDREPGYGKPEPPLAIAVLLDPAPEQAKHLAELLRGSHEVLHRPRFVSVPAPQSFPRSVRSL